jgi:hypothetical protein
MSLTLSQVIQVIHIITSFNQRRDGMNTNPDNRGVIITNRRSDVYKKNRIK